MEFLQALFTQSFLQQSFLMGILASIACGVIGSFVVVKRLVFLSGGISHSILGGMGIALFMGAHPLWGAIISAIVVAVAIGLIRLRANQREDTLIGAMWAVGMALGIVLISRTPGYNVDLMSYLFGNILMITETHVWIVVGLDLIILSCVWFFYKPLLAICFDEEFARIRSIPVEFMYILLLCLIALTIVVLIQVVGIILVIALLTLPAAIASDYVNSLARMMIVASLLGVGFTTGGMAISYSPDLPTGATIILVAGFAYFLSVIWVSFRSSKRIRSRT